MGKKTLNNAHCGSPANLFSKTSPWKDYLVKVKGAHAWQLHLPILDDPVEDEDLRAETAELTESA